MVLQVFVNGPPGSGKTTVAKQICEEFDLQMISTGDLLRENILLHSETGLVAKNCIAKKEIVPDDVVVRMVVEKIQQCNENQQPWLLDGFPRTKKQSEMLQQRKVSPNAMILLDTLQDKDVLKRITGRRFDPVTGNIYHSPCVLPVEANVRARLTRRADDVPEKVVSRIEAYKLHGKAVAGFYRSMEHKVNANREPQQVMEDIRDVILSLQPKPKEKHKSSKKSHMSSLMSHSIDRVDEAQEDEDDNVREDQRLEGDDDQQEQEEQRGTHKLTLFTKKSSSPVRKQPQQKAQSKPKQQPQQPSQREQQNQPASLASSVIFRSEKVATEDGEDQVGDDNLDAFVHEDEPEDSPSTTSKETMGQEREPVPVVPPSSAPVGGPSTAAPLASTAPTASTSTKAPPDYDMDKFRQWLVEGIDLTKHGRRGAPHLRTVFCDVEFKRVFWQKPNSKKDLKAKIDQSLALADVLQVLRGMKTEVLKRSGHVTKYERYFSLIADDRTLDLETSSEEMCEFLAKGFELIVPEN